MHFKIKQVDSTQEQSKEGYFLAPLESLGMDLWQLTIEKIFFNCLPTISSRETRKLYIKGNVIKYTPWLRKYLQCFS